MKVLLTTLLMILSFTTIAAEIPGSFGTSKKKLLKEVYFDRKISFYCGCSFNMDKVVNQKSCGYEPRNPLTSKGKENLRDNGIEWEHVLPASHMSKNLTCSGEERGQYEQCVKNNGKLRGRRDCCQRVNQDFRDAHNDMNNLTPAIGEVNANRSNHAYGEIAGELRKYGACDFEFENNVAEPAPHIRGDIARIQMYLLDEYGEKLGFAFSAEKQAMLKRWAGEDPVSDWELKRNQRICDVQGQGNPYVAECD